MEYKYFPCLCFRAWRLPCFNQTWVCSSYETYLERSQSLLQPRCPVYETSNLIPQPGQCVLVGDTCRFVGTLYIMLAFYTCICFTLFPCLYVQKTAQEGRSGSRVVQPVLSHVPTIMTIYSALNSVCRDVSVPRGRLNSMESVLMLTHAPVWVIIMYMYMSHTVVCSCTASIPHLYIAQYSCVYQSNFLRFYMYFYQIHKFSCRLSRSLYCSSL